MHSKVQIPNPMTPPKTSACLNRYYHKRDANHFQDRSHDDLFHDGYWIFSILIPQGWAFTFSISSSERSTDHWVET